MIGTTLDFVKQLAGDLDAMGNPIISAMNISIDDCLIAPISEPTNVREQQAIDQSRDQVRIHLPKATTEDVSNAFVEWDDKVFKIDSDSVVFMDGNTPTRWNRYFRAESIGSGTFPDFDLVAFFITENSDEYIQQEGA